MPRSSPSRGIFISYRRDDTSGFAGRLYDRLAARYGADRVFMDIDTILPSSDFSVEIERALSNSAACIVLIGRQWVSITKDDGSRRLDDPTDFVRLEVGAALRRGVAVFPVLVDGASPPSSGSLPEDIKEVAGRHAIELSNERWNYDVGRLILALDEVVQEKGPHRRRGERPKWPILVAAAVIAVLVAGVGAWAMTRGGTEEAENSDPPPSSPGTPSPSFLCGSGPPPAPIPSGEALDGTATYSVDLILASLDGEPAQNSLWGQPDPPLCETTDEWTDQTWTLSTTESTWEVEADHTRFPNSEIGVGDVEPQGDGAFVLTSEKPVRGCDIATREADVAATPDSIDGLLTIRYRCPEGPVAAVFTIAGQRSD